MRYPRLPLFALMIWLALTSFTLVAQAANCTKDADCSLGQICQLQFGSGACVFPPTCSTDADCSGGKTCQFTSATTKACQPPPASSPSPSSGAQPDSGPVKLQNPLSASTVPQLVANILNTAVGMVGAISLLIFIYGGLRWLTSGGEPAKIQAGKDAMKWAAIGLVVIFSSYALVTFAFKALTG